MGDEPSNILQKFSHAKKRPPPPVNSQALEPYRLATLLPLEGAAIAGFFFFFFNTTGVADVVCIVNPVALSVL